VFGSVVRGEEREDSDIDLLVEFSPGATLLDQARRSVSIFRSAVFCAPMPWFFSVR
jgi:predicted nucleotidyltransferase